MLTRHESVRESEGHDLRHLEPQSLVKHDAEVDVHDLRAALVQQDVVQVAVAQAKQVTNLWGQPKHQFDVPVVCPSTIHKGCGPYG